MSENKGNDPKFEYFKAKVLEHLDSLLEMENAEKRLVVKKKNKKDTSKQPSSFMLRVLDEGNSYKTQIKQQCTIFKERYGHFPNVLVASKETLEKIAPNSEFEAKERNALKIGQRELAISESEEFKSGTYELLDVQSEILAQNHFVYPLIDMKKTGETIKRLMDENNISVKDLQKLLRLASVQAIYYWLNGDKIPSIDNLCILSHFFNVPIDDILSVKLLEEDS